MDGSTFNVQGNITVGLDRTETFVDVFNSMAAGMESKPGFES